MTDKEAMKLALDALETLMIERGSIYEKAIAALKERLAQPADPTGQAPCARHCEAMAFQIVIKNLRGEIERLKAPQRTWVGLTDDEIKAFDTWHNNREEEVGWCNPSEIVAYIEAKLKEKNA